MKKLATWVLAFVFLFSFALPQGTASAQSYDLNWTVDDVKVEGNLQPFMLNDKVLIPVEKLFKDVGFKVSKDESGKVNVTNTHLTVDFDAAAGEIKVNGEKATNEFPIAERNNIVYISSEFLARLEGFSVKVAADHLSVAIKTNRIQDVSAFIEKTMDADLNSQSTNLTIDMEMASSLEEETIKMLMAIQSDDILDPISSHSITKTSTSGIGDEAIEDVSETYITEDGFFQKTGDTWIKYDDSMTELLQGITTAHEALLPQLEELQLKFSKGINIFEYDNTYMMTQSLTTAELKDMLKEASSLLSGLLPVIETEDLIVDEDTIEGTATEEVILDEVVFEEGDFEAIFDSLGLNVKEFYFVSNFDKETLFPVDLSGNAHITMAMGEDTVSMKMIINGTFSNFNSIKEIKVPEEVIKNAISMEEYFEQLEAQFENQAE